MAWVLHGSTTVGAAFAARVGKRAVSYGGGSISTRSHGEATIRLSQKIENTSLINPRFVRGDCAIVFIFREAASRSGNCRAIWLAISIALVRHRAGPENFKSLSLCVTAARAVAMTLITLRGEATSASAHGSALNFVTPCMATLTFCVKVSRETADFVARMRGDERLANNARV